MFVAVVAALIVVVFMAVVVGLVDDIVIAG
jgi:hypothetical protein